MEGEFFARISGGKAGSRMKHRRIAVGEKASHSGRTAAKALAKDLIGHPEDQARADSARSTMLSELAR